MSDLSISMLGAFQATLNEEPLAQFRTKSVQALLIYLVCEAERPHQRESLMDLLWPGMPLKSAQHNLRQTIYRLRKILPEVNGNDGNTAVPLILADRQSLRINSQADYWADVQAFEALAKNDPARASDLYRGDFLSDFYLPDSETFEAWAAAKRAVYRRQVLLVLETVTGGHLQEENFAAAEQLARRSLAIDNLRESSHRQLLQALVRSGNRQDALAHYGELRQLLKEELAIEPEAETAALVEAIRSGDLTRTKPIAAADSIQPTPEAKRPKHNLPRLLSSFVGRKEEMNAVTGLIGEHPLVMLTGAGGIGKTNLCLQVGRQSFEAFPDGVWLVELAPLADPDLVTKTAAYALGLRELPEYPIEETLLDFLQRKKCLLILDNCEHLIASAAQFVQMVLQACDDVKILASSREALGVPGEIPYRVPPLSFPDVRHMPAAEAWDQYDAVRLFVERATAVLPSFQVTDENFAPLAQICGRLDGIPLALELAAARVNVLSVQQIADRLDDRFRLLTGGSRTALPRQQTLRALIDWSWELLTEDEQELLQRLSVFAGGMELEAIEEVCVGDRLDPYDLLNVLSELVNKSLVIARREQGQETRYRLLETIRQYAQERLGTVGKSEKYRQRHQAYFLNMAKKAHTELVGPDQAAWHHKLEQELDNVRAALRWARETGVEAGLQIICALYWFWWARGYIREADAWLGHLLAIKGPVTPQIRAEALILQSEYKQTLANLERCRALAEESLAIYQELGDRRGILTCARKLSFIRDKQEYRKTLLESVNHLRKSEDKLELAGVLTSLAYNEAELNNFKQALVYLEESESLYREVGHLAMIAEVLGNSGHYAVWQGDLGSVRSKLEESLAIQERLGSGRNHYNYYLLGKLHFHQHNYPQARAYFDKSLSMSQEYGLKYMNHWGLVHLGYVSLREGKINQARKRFEVDVRHFREVGEPSGVGFAIEGLAGLAVSQKAYERATQLFAWADTSRAARNDPRPPVEQADVDRNIGVILENMNKEAYDVAWKVGKKMTEKEAIGYALELETEREE